MKVEQSKPYLLLPLKPSRKKPIPGDIFVIHIRNVGYLLGLVVKTEVNGIDLFHGNLVYVYRNILQEPAIPDKFGPEELLIAPSIINKQGWLKGYFLTIGHKDITDSDLRHDTAFWHPRLERYLDENRQEVSFIPVMHSLYGMGNHLTLEDKIHRTIQEGKLG